MRPNKVLPFILVITIFMGNVCGQIYSPAANDSFGAAYNVAGGTDKVFIYNREKYRQPKTVSIVAVSEDKQTGWNFQWAVYDHNASGYVPVGSATSDWFSTVDTLTVSSGYQVTMTKGASLAVYRVWLVFNDFQVAITNKDTADKLQFGYYNCSSLDLRSDTTAPPSYYFNPLTGEKNKVFNSYTIRWKTNNPEASIPPSRLITRVTSPPSEDTWYKLNVTDRFKLLRTDSVFYKSIQSKAAMTSSYVNLSDSTEYPKAYGDRYNDNIQSAPGKFRFDISASKNAVSYKLDFGDEETLQTDTAGTSIIHEYKIPGIYKVVLTTKSDKPYECADTVTTTAELVYGKIVLPNVFSPDVTGESLKQSNDLFRSEDISVVDIEITIFDRAGIKMHTYSGNIRDWAGWDGIAMHTHLKAPSGVYFYVISSLVYFKDPNGTATNKISKKVYSGFFHLYRK
jgi:hypothetical protein